MMTPGDKRWIKNWKPKGVNINPTKTKPAKKKPAKRNDNSIIGKLLKLNFNFKPSNTLLSN